MIYSVGVHDRLQKGRASGRLMEELDKSEKYTVRDIGLADKGSLLVDWARARMPVLAKLKAEAERTKPLAGMRVAGCLHVTKETAVPVSYTHLTLPTTPYV